METEYDSNDRDVRFDLQLQEKKLTVIFDAASSGLGRRGNVAPPAMDIIVTDKSTQQIMFDDRDYDVKQ